MPALRQAIKQDNCPEDMDIVPSLCCLLASLLTASTEVAEAVADDICKSGAAFAWKSDHYLVRVLMLSSLIATLSVQVLVCCLTLKQQLLQAI